MAAQQAFFPYSHHSEGSLMPGQTISVNKYTVQVERYLSKGGFAYVYLVRTQTPVYNTTHHVLKHIVVANESALTEVKKEVDVMRLLRGHTNIVYLIDAAWAKMPNGAFEVYILMEYCPGGGIIDMMNRRLRERLTEAEILQIFVEVCEGVAHMHHSRPPLLHRDLKVENILQSSATSFKLCDFGSAATVSKPPTNSQEMRALEADLNRHTTLQYRAPEMIDLHSRRPIDEKSDVWALGVLLYKLCYYTTPFEEHGPLAILNVQYRFPSYPVYSQQMTNLTSSMLREHGAQRPTVFEILTHVHSLRGTKSSHNYPIPKPAPLSPRQSDPLNGVITYRQPVQSDFQSTSKTQAARPVELAVPQERRGRPKPSSRENVSSSRTSTPLKLPAQHSEKPKAVDDHGFGVDGDAAWSSAVVKNTSTVGQGDAAIDEAWNMPPSGREKTGKLPPLSPGAGFNDDFAQKLWATTSSGPVQALLPTSSPRPQSYSPKLVSSSHAALASGESQKIRHEPQARTSKERDAFEGLGLITSISKPAPTLAEARKLRTGLAVMSTNVNKPIRPSPSPRLRPKLHTPRVSPIPPLHSLDPEQSGWSSSKPTNNKGGFTAETRFPSLEELDASFSNPGNTSISIAEPRGSNPTHRTPEPPSLPLRPNKVEGVGTGPGAGIGTTLLKPAFAGHGVDGTRSEQVTGFAMRDAKGDHPRRAQEEDFTLQKREKREHEKRHTPNPPSPVRLETSATSRPSSFKENKSATRTHTSVTSTFEPLATSQRPSPSITSINHSSRSKDWLTGDDEPDVTSRPPHETRPGHDVFKIRESPSKRASVIERIDVVEATIPQQGHTLTPPIKNPPRETATTTVESPTVSRFMKSFPAIDTTSISSQPSSNLTDSWSPVAATTSHSYASAERDKGESSSSGDEGPEEPIPFSSIPSRASNSRAKRKGRQSSVHDLVDLWGGGLTSTREKQPESPTSVKHNAETSKIRPAYPSTTRAASPPRRTSPLPSSVQNPPLQFPGTEQPSQQSVGLPPSPSLASGGARPQSMFIFPSKSIDTISQSSASLLPPEEPKPRSSRRTSISDMVQRYEAIQASTRVFGTASTPSPINFTKPLPPARDSIHDAPSSRPVKPGLDKLAVALPGLGTPSISSQRSGDPIKRRTSLTVPATRSSLNIRHLSPVEKQVEVSGASTENESLPPRTRTTSVIQSQPVKLHPVTGRKPVPSSEELIRQSQTDSTSPPSANNDRSPSPERPYQGVGKLIDQWQRKSAEAEASRNTIVTKRTSLAPTKRAGLVPNTEKIHD